MIIDEKIKEIDHKKHNKYINKKIEDKLNEINPFRKYFQEEFTCSKCHKLTDWISWDGKDLCLECYLKIEV